MWRTGSTYLFDVFRHADRYLAFYEPFHEALGSRRRLAAERSTFGASRSRLSHPDMASSYFAEYPLTDRGTAPRYKTAFAVSRFFASNVAEEMRYLGGLAAHAADRGRTPVFGFCRSAGRLPQLRASILGRHIYLYRSPRRQWLSYETAGRTYFLPLTLAQLATHADARPRLEQVLGKRLPTSARHSAVYGTSRGFWVMERVFARACAALCAADRYAIFYAMWLTSMGRADAVGIPKVSVHGLFGSLSVRAAFEDEFSVRLTGLRDPDRAITEADSLWLNDVERRVERSFGDGLPALPSTGHPPPSQRAEHGLAPSEHMGR